MGKGTGSFANITDVFQNMALRKVGSLHCKMNLPQFDPPCCTRNGHFHWEQHQKFAPLVQDLPFTNASQPSWLRKKVLTLQSN
eukprot:3750126-Ditylum_brightwellii.AAC.1